MTQSTPVAATILGVRQVIFITQTGLVAVAPKTGSVLWRQSFPYKTSTGISPVVSGDIVYSSAAYGVGAGAYRIAKSAEGFSSSQLWFEGGNGKAKANAAVTVTNEEAVVRAAAIRRALSDAVDPHNAVSVDMIRRLLRELVPVLQRYAAGHRTGIVLPVVETTAVHTNVGVRSTGLNVPTVTVVAMPAITPVNPVRNLRTPLAPKRDRADKPDRSTSGRKRAMPSPLPPVGGLQDDDGLLDGQGSLPLDFLDDQDDVFVLSPQIRGFEAV